MSSTHCFIRTENRSWSCKALEFIISKTLQCKHYISIAHTGNFIMCVLG